jgi:signal transduction histidine kinase/CheY-like chemotaxis protein
MSRTLNTEAVELLESWESELAQRNQRGARVAVYLVLALYPLFGILDYLIAPSESLPYLFSGRGLIVGISIFMLSFINQSSFFKHNEILSAMYMFLVGAGITFMISFMGGLSSHYYAGLSLVMLGCGLLFTWSPQICLITHSLTFILWLLPNLCLVPILDTVAAISNGFFLFATTCIVIAGQVFNYQRLKSQYITQSDLIYTRNDLYKAHKELKKLDSFKSRFFANITHELKTPLALILSSTEFLLRDEFGPLNTKQRSPVQQVQRHGVKLLKLINDLLDLTKLEESSLKLKVKLCDVVNWSDQLLKEIKPLAERKGVSVHFESTLTNTKLHFDPERMERVIVNLLSNAAKFTESGGQITFSIWGDEHKVQISVTDTGQGFTEEQAKDLFERFYQTDMGSDRKYGGTGIGLSLSKELVELHGGEISAFGEVGEGATFTIALLRGINHFDEKRVIILEEEESDSIFEEAQDRSNDVTQIVSLKAEEELRFVELEEASDRRVLERDQDEDHRSATVLIAEDNPDITRLLHIGLRRHFKVVAAENGLKALELADRFSPSLIITDLMMPKMDGMELTKRLKSEPRYLNTPILMLSARDGIEEEMTEAGYPANAYMAKPFSTRELCKLAKSLVKNAHESRV